MVALPAGRLFEAYQAQAAEEQSRFIINDQVKQYHE